MASQRKYPVTLTAEDREALERVTRAGVNRRARLLLALDRRIGDLDVLDTELAAWQHQTNAEQRQVDWKFATQDARIKLRHLYPTHKQE